ncbi:MAG: ABC transporter permease, partial [Hyphomicrobiales bacterium]
MSTIVEARTPPKREINRPWTWQRYTGWAFLGVYAIIGFFLVRMVVVGFDPEFVSRYFPRMLGGLWVTVKLVVISITLGALIAFPMALARNSKNWFLRRFAFYYIYFFRGTPLLAQVFLVYYGAGQFRPALQDAGLWWLFRDAYFCALFTFTLNTAAYQAEILRGAISSVARGQWEAAQALGLSTPVTYYKVILPQALISSLRPLGNEIIFMIKGSAVASIITVFDLMGETALAFSRSFDFQVYLWAACLYLAIVETLRRVWDV